MSSLFISIDSKFDYMASGSPIYPCTSLWGINTLYMGNGNAKFTIRHGEITVDQLRIRITSADRSRLLHEFFVPVKYHYTSEPTEDFSVGISNWSDSLLTNYIFLDGKAVIYDTIQPRDGCFCEGDLCICKKPDYKFKGYDLRLEHGTHTIKAIVFSYYFGIFMPVGIINDNLFNVQKKSEQDSDIMKVDRSD